MFIISRVPLVYGESLQLIDLLETWRTIRLHTWLLWHDVYLVCIFDVDMHLHLLKTNRKFDRFCFCGFNAPWVFIFQLFYGLNALYDTAEWLAMPMMGGGVLFRSTVFVLMLVFNVVRNSCCLFETVLIVSDIMENSCSCLMKLSQ